MKLDVGDVKLTQDEKEFLLRKEIALATYNPEHAILQESAIQQSYIMKILKEVGMNLFNIQRFVGLFIDLFSGKETRMLIKYKPGSGKSLALLNLIKNSITHYGEMYEITLEVYVITYSYSVITTQGVKYAELPFSSMESQISPESTQNQFNVSNSRIKMSHYGYIMFANAVFTINNEESFFTLFDSYPTKDPEILIAVAVKAKWITIHYDFVYSLKGALLVCDESQKMYMGTRLNNNGIAFLIVVMHVTVNVIFLCGTPMNKIATEIALKAKLLSKNKTKYKFSDFFAKIETEDGKVLPNPYALAKNWKEVVKAYYKGIVCSSGGVENTKTPKLVSPGTTITIKHQNEEIVIGRTFPMTFVNPVASLVSFHAKNQNVALSAFLFCANFFGTYVYNKETLVEAFKKHEAEMAKINVFKKTVYSSKNTGGVSPSTTITGKYLVRTNIHTFSAKYDALFSTLFDGDKPVLSEYGKKAVFIDIVNFPGIYFAEELFAENGIIEYEKLPNKNTLCSHCLHPLKEHSVDEQKHTVIDNCCERGTCMIRHVGLDHSFKCQGFEPMSYISVHAYTKDVVANLELFKEPINAHGAKIMFLLASEVIGTAYTITNVSNLFLMTIPKTFSGGVQLVLRFARPYSIESLPYENIVARLLVTMGEGVNKELALVTMKAINFKEITKVNNYLDTIGMDAPIHDFDYTGKKLSISHFNAYKKWDTLENELVASIKMMFSIYRFLTIDQIVYNIQNGIGYISTMNLKYANFCDILSAFYKILISPSNVSTKFFATNKAINALYKTTSANVIIDNEGNRLKIAHYTKDIFVAMLIDNVLSNKKEAMFLSQIYKSKSFLNFDLMVNKTIGPLELKKELVGFSEHAQFIMYCSKFSKSDLTILFQYFIENYEKLEKQEYSFLNMYVQLFEIYTNAMLISPMAEVPMGRPIAYKVENKIKVYNPITKKWTQVISAMIRIMNEMPKLSFYGLFHNTDYMKLVKTDKDSNPSDGRKTSIGKKCQTYDINTVRDLYTDLTDLSPGDKKAIILCAKITNYFLMYQFVEWLRVSANNPEFVPSIGMEMAKENISKFVSIDIEKNALNPIGKKDEVKSSIVKVKRYIYFYWTTQ